MTHRRAFLRAIALLSVAAPVAAIAGAAPALAQPKGPGDMPKGRGIRIQHEGERRIFGDLLCMCGCNRESLAECSCGVADDYRDEVRAMMTEGLTHEQIKLEWVKRYGTHSLSVPPNTGANRLLYVAPLVAIVAMAAFVVTVLRRFRARGQEKTAAAPASPVAAAGPDEYDRKLDEELKQLDDE